MAKLKTEVKENIIPICDGKYELVNHPAIVVNTGIGDFDLANLTEEQCEQLIKAGFEFIKKS